MKKEANLGLRQHIPQHLRQHGQVVVVDPDQVTVPVDVLYSVREALIHRLLSSRRGEGQWVGLRCTGEYDRITHLRV